MRFPAVLTAIALSLGSGPALACTSAAGLFASSNDCPGRTTSAARGLEDIRLPQIGLAEDPTPVAEAVAQPAVAMSDTSEPKFIPAAVDPSEIAALPGEGGAKRVEAVRSTPILDAGDMLPDDAMVMLNTEYYGLPAARDGWWYYQSDRQVYRADPDTREILERVTHLVNSNY